VDTLDQRKDFQPVALEDHVSGFLLVDFLEQPGILLNQGIDIGVIN